VISSSPELGLHVDQAFLGSDLEGKQAWSAAAEAGATWIGITEEAISADEERLARLRDDAASVGITIAVAGCHAFGLSDPRDVVREWNLERAKLHVDLVPLLGASQLKVLLGEWVWRTMWPDEVQWATLVDSVRSLCSHAEQRGVELSLELEPLDTALVNDVKSLNRIIVDVDSAALRANVDISHMVVRGLSHTEICLIDAPINSVDFSDSNGRYHEHLPPGSGVANLDAYTGELSSAAGEQTLIGVEVGPFHDPETAYRRVRESMEATEALFTRALTRNAAARG
jgi:D-psicose/D-tagatose/L-ribulose 3-epimerase